MVLARIIEPTSKADSLRVLGEVAVDPVPSYATLKRRLPVWATEGVRAEAGCGLRGRRAMVAGDCFRAVAVTAAYRHRGLLQVGVGLTPT